MPISQWIYTFETLLSLETKVAEGISTSQKKSMACLYRSTEFRFFDNFELLVPLAIFFWGFKLCIFCFYRSMVLFIRSESPPCVFLCLIYGIIGNTH